MMDELLIPDWGCEHAAGAPPGVRALVTTRLSLQGCSAAPYEYFNLALHVGDDPLAVMANRGSLRRLLPAEPLWLNQVHGTEVACADDDRGDAAVVPTADASCARAPGRVCVVLTADCLPLLLAARDGSVVAAAHAGWRGLAAGVIEATVAAMGVPAADVQVWLGPAIGPAAFEVGAEVRAAFCRHDPQAALAFRAQGGREKPDRSNEPDKWLCDLYMLARQRLAALGVRQVSGGGLCTWSDERRFYSYRRDGATGRMASLIWRE
ncbi:conserved hypothetical protein [Sterolibacterium denitrificans]|uniref:Purine nucleoside phosphorylase n=2 Tax=Sterolibacterium denitrificans TaxID=157592 RepID=A0A7Z7HS81_9PROT|nr:conserved hypothetical protein [Sterolibacterium denitrificans]